MASYVIHDEVGGNPENVTIRANKQAMSENQEGPIRAKEWSGHTPLSSLLAGRKSKRVLASPKNGRPKATRPKTKNS
jgi:hypothetical protein